MLNPALTIPLILAAKYTQKGGLLASEYGAAFKYLKLALALGLVNRVNSWLNDAVTNNWINDTYNWSREVVVVTGGSDGIGKIIVQLFAEKGIKVAVLDVQELTYTGELLCILWTLESGMHAQCADRHRYMVKMV